MDSFKGLIDAHVNANRLAKEIKKIRGNIIKSYKEKNSSDLYLLKINYAGFAEHLAKETATFNTLLNNLDINNCDNETDNYEEITYNSMDSDSTLNESQGQQVLSESYTNSNIELEQVKKDIHTEAEVIKNVTEPYTNSNNSNIELEEENKDIIEAELVEKEEDKNTVHLNELYNDSVPMTDDLSIDNTQMVAESVASNVTQNSTKDITEYPSLNGHTNTPADINNKWNDSTPTPAAVQKRRRVKVTNNKSAYKYGGRGFAVFKGTAIYSATMLKCDVTCDENEDALRDYLVKNGKFKNDMIEQVIFKTRGYYKSYALLKVRGELKYIKRKINTLNKATGKKIIKIFHRAVFTSAKEWANANNVLYVNNFDIMNKHTHEKFTKYMSKYGELQRDIRMGADKNKDPYAIVQFRDINDATYVIRAAKKSELAFGGKVLSIRFFKQY